MLDPLAARFDATPYHHGAIAHSHPARLGAIGRLHGLATASPERCRVLELGCAAGLNLLPLAERFPEAEFLGMDFSQVSITKAESARVDCGLDNARFVCADLRTSPELEAVLFLMEEGQLSEVVESPIGFHLLYCETKQPESVASLEDATPKLREWLESRLRQKRQREWLVGLLQQHASLEKVAHG